MSVFGRLAQLIALLQAALGTRPPAVAAVPRAPLEHAPLDVLAAKIVFAHLRNRQQLMGPPPTALGQLDAGQAELLIHAVVVAAHANGRMSEHEERLMRAAVSSIGLQSQTAGFLEEAIRHPVPLEVLLRDVRDGHLASLVYTASLLAIDKRDAVNRSYLAYLARRLNLPEEALARLHSQQGYEA